MKISHCKTAARLSVCIEGFVFAELVRPAVIVSVYVDVHHGKTTLENCVLQCETTGITVRTSAELLMRNSDLYGAKVHSFLTLAYFLI